MLECCLAVRDNETPQPRKGVVPRPLLPVRRSLDAALVSPGEPWALPRLSTQPDMEEGMAFNLVNNVWG